MFELRYSHNIIEHLGLKLYQNKPTNVIAELISNAWDADAENVWINLNNDCITVIDDGHGMSSKTLKEHYLLIAKLKRTKETLDARSPDKKRKFMGRKGIGKLAPFGIAKKISLITLDKETSNVCWFVMDLEKILNQPQEQPNLNLEIELETIYDDKPLSKLTSENNPNIQAFLTKIQANKSPSELPSGTMILMENLSLRREIPIDKLHESVGRRFTVTLMRDDFSVYINDEKTDKDKALPPFDYRIPKDDERGLKTIRVNQQEREIRYWVGFVDKAQWPQDQAGVGIYTHGKIAQDRPFFFGVKGKEIRTRYMYGVIEADWLDELPDDVVSTDRTSINWDSEETEVLYQFGHDLINSWITEYINRNKKREKEDIKQILSDNAILSHVTPVEKDAVINMVCELGAYARKNKELREKVTEQLTTAMTRHPTRQLIKEVWDSIDTEIDDNDKFLGVLENLNKYLVPESLSLSVSTAQRIYAISKLANLHINGKETQLQKLLEQFPWLLSPDMAKLTANQELKTVIEEGAKQGLIPAYGVTDKNIKNNDRLRPDFIFLSDGDMTEIMVVELKTPEIDLNFEHEAQLVAYINFLRSHYPNADANIKGILIGRNPNDQFKSDNIRVQVMTWNRLFTESRKEYGEFLSAMLYGADKHPDDPRVLDAMIFGGEETQALLRKMGETNPDLKDLMHKLDEQIKRLGRKVGKQ